MLTSELLPINTLFARVKPIFSDSSAMSRIVKLLPNMFATGDDDGVVKVRLQLREEMNLDQLFCYL